MTETPPPNTTPPPPPPSAPAPVVVQPDTHNHRSKAMIWITVILIACALLWLLIWFFYLRFHQWTDDAYAGGNLIAINSVVAGMPIGIYADNTDLVLEGQVLVKLDPTPFQIELDQELSNLASIARDVRQLYDSVTANVANVEAKQALLRQSLYDYQNRRGVVDTGAISNEDYTHSKDSYSVAEQALKQAEANLAMAKHAAGRTLMPMHPRIEQQRNKVRTAYYNLCHCNIVAPSTGYVAWRKVQVGQWVTPTTNMMAVIPVDEMWVDANYLETQLTHMRIGQPVTVTFDIYGSDVVFEGKVVGIASGSGSVFSLIPPQNATGNWIKIVQRLPVRISIDPEKRKRYPLRLGLSAEVDVDVTETDLPMLAQIPASQPIATTSVNILDWKLIEEMMETVVMQNLEIYHARVEIENLDRAKAPGLADRKSIHISNINRLTIDQPRELSHGTKSLFQPARGIDAIAAHE